MSYIRPLADEHTMHYRNKIWTDYNTSNNDDGKTLEDYFLERGFSNYSGPDLSITKEGGSYWIPSGVQITLSQANNKRRIVACKIGNTTYWAGNSGQIVIVTTGRSAINQCNLLWDAIYLYQNQKEPYFAHLESVTASPTAAQYVNTLAKAQNVEDVRNSAWIGNMPFISYRVPNYNIQNQTGEENHKSNLFSIGSITSGTGSPYKFKNNFQVNYSTPKADPEHLHYINNNVVPIVLFASGKVARNGKTYKRWDITGPYHVTITYTDDTTEVINIPTNATLTWHYRDVDTGFEWTGGESSNLIDPRYMWAFSWKGHTYTFATPHMYSFFGNRSNNPRSHTITFRYQIPMEHMQYDWTDGWHHHITVPINKYYSNKHFTQFRPCTMKGNYGKDPNKNFLVTMGNCEGTDSTKYNALYSFDFDAMIESAIWEQLEAPALSVTQQFTVSNLTYARPYEVRYEYIHRRPDGLINEEMHDNVILGTLQGKWNFTGGSLGIFPSKVNLFALQRQYTATAFEDDIKSTFKQGENEWSNSLMHNEAGGGDPEDFYVSVWYNSRNSLLQIIAGDEYYSLRMQHPYVRTAECLQLDCSDVYITSSAKTYYEELVMWTDTWYTEEENIL